MPRQPDGTYNLPQNPWTEAQPGEVIQSAPKNVTEADISQTLTDSVDRNGKGKALADLSMGGYHHTEVSNATAADQYAAANQVATNSLTYCGQATGDGNNIFLTNPMVNAYVPGMIVTFSPNISNTMSTVVVNLNSLGSKDVKYANGDPLGPFTIRSNIAQQLIYTGDHFVISNPIEITTPVKGDIKEFITLAFSLGSVFSNVAETQWINQYSVRWNAEHDLGASTPDQTVTSTNPLYVPTMTLEDGYDYDIIVVGPATWPAVLQGDLAAGSMDCVKFYNGGIVKIKNINLDSVVNLTGTDGFTFNGGVCHKVDNGFFQMPGQNLSMFGGILGGLTMGSETILSVRVATTVGNSIGSSRPISYESAFGAPQKGRTYDFSSPAFANVSIGSEIIFCEDIEINPYGFYSENNSRGFGTTFGDSTTTEFTATLAQAQANIAQLGEGRHSLLKVVKKHR